MTIFKYILLQSSTKFLLQLTLEFSEKLCNSVVLLVLSISQDCSSDRSDIPLGTG